MDNKFEIPTIDIIKLVSLDVLTTSAIPEEPITPDPGPGGLPIL